MLFVNFILFFNRKKILSPCSPKYLVYPLRCRNSDLETTALQTKAVRCDNLCLHPAKRMLLS